MIDAALIRKMNTHFMNQISSDGQSLVRCCRAGSKRLTDYLSSLPPESWRNPSACKRWEVQDVVGHLAWGAKLYISTISRGIEGDTSPPAEYPPEGNLNRETYPEWAAQEAIVYRERQGEQLLADFMAGNTQLNKLMAELRPQDWKKSCYHPLGLREVKILALFRAIELAMHAWDIQSVMEPSTSLLPESLPILMERIPGMLSGTFQPDNRLKVPILYRFLVKGAVPEELDLVIEGDRLRIEPIGTAEAQATFRCDTETFTLLMFHRLNPETAISNGRLIVQGDHGLAMTFGKWFKFV